MEVILLRDIEGVGKEGDKIKAKDGYARNFLIPKKMASLCTPGVLKALEIKKKKKTEALVKEKAKAQELAKAVGALSLTISMESGEGDQLFGSITSELVSKALIAENVHINKKDITLPDSIKKLGVYTVIVKLHPEVKADLRIWVVKK